MFSSSQITVTIVSSNLTSTELHFSKNALRRVNALGKIRDQQIFIRTECRIEYGYGRSPKLRITTSKALLVPDSVKFQLRSAAYRQFLDDVVPIARWHRRCPYAH
jgi:hypothetical protein